MILLDTHAWVWLVNDPQELSKRARDAISEATAKRSIYISSISVWEVALLVATGRLELTLDVQDWIAKSEALPFFTFVPVDNATFVRSVLLPGPLHADPADRIIIATAIMKGMPVVTKDQRIRRYARVKCIW
jgi:PIN domain nuclease of toxin-antitoxin system